MCANVRDICTHLCTYAYLHPARELLLDNAEIPFNRAKLHINGALPSYTRGIHSIQRTECFLAIFVVCFFLAACCLQCVAVCCSVLKCGAVCCSGSYKVCCSVLQCVAVCCSVLQCVAVC